MTDAGLPEVLRQTLCAYALRRRRVLVLRGLGETLAVEGLGLAGIAAIDMVAHPSAPLCWGLSLTVHAAAGAVLVGRVLLPATRRLRLVDHAQDIERRCAGHLQERLSSAVELAGRPAEGVSAWMIERTIALAAQEAASLDVRALVSPRPARLAWMRAGLITASLALCCVIPGVWLLLARAAWPALQRPSRIHLDVQPGDVRLASGSALDLTVIASPDPGAVSVAMVWDDAVSERMELTRGVATGQYGLRIGAVTTGLKYRVLAGDGESRPYRVDLARPPVLEKITLHITPPAYTGLPGRIVDGGDAEVITGSRVDLEAHISASPIVAGSLIYDGGEHAATITDGVLRTGLTSSATLSYGLRLVGASGLVAEPPQRWLLTVFPDKPPLVNLTGHGLEAGLVGSDETLMVEVAASDDIGLRALAVVVAVDGSERRRVPLRLPPGRCREATCPLAVDCSGLALAIGQSISLTAIATDVGGQTSTSTPVVVAVAPGGDAGGAELAGVLEDVLHRVDAQTVALHALARQWSMLSNRDHGADQATITGQLKLLAGRIELWAGEMAPACQQLCSTGVASPVANAPQVLDLGEELTAWTRGEAHQLDLACRDGQSADGAAAVLRGRELCEAALADLGGFHRDLALIVARLQASTLAGGTSAAFARMERALPIARGERGWRGDSHGNDPGLLGQFYAGTELKGNERFREMGVPIWRNRDVPGIGRSEFSVRYSGEVFIPSAGAWTFVAGADDGVRLWVDGHSLLPSASWRSHAYTEFPGNCTLSAGWHPIVLEMFQGEGDSGLGLAMGRDEHSVEPVTLANLHVLAPHATAELVTAMAELPRDQVAAAAERLRSAFLAIATVPEAIRVFSGIAANDEVNALSRTNLGPAALLTGTAAHLRNADLPALVACERACRDLTADAIHARALLENQVSRELHGRVHPGDLSALRQALARVRDRVQGLYHIPERMSAQDRDLRLGIEWNAGRAWISELGREAASARLSLLDECRRQGALLGTRDAALLGARHLAALLPGVRKALADLAAMPGDSHLAADRLNAEADRLGDLLRAAEDWEHALDRQHSGEVAQAAVVLLPARAGGKDAGNGNDEVSAQVVEMLRQLRARARRAGDEARTSALAQLLESSGDPRKRAAAIAETLERLSHECQGWFADLDQETADQLRQSAQDLAQRTGDEQIQATVVDLDEARLALGLEGERHLGLPPQGLAGAFTQLSHDIAFVVDGRQQPTPPQVFAFAERAAALANQHGDAQRAAEIAASGQHHDPPADPSALAALAEQAHVAADHPAERASVLSALTALAAADAARAHAADAQHRADLQQHLADLETQAAAADAAELAARQEFANAQRHLAQELPALGDQASAAAGKSKDQDVAKALDQAGRDLPQTGQQIAALARAAEQPPAALATERAQHDQQPQPGQHGQDSQDAPAQSPALTTGVASADLVRQADAIADHLSEQDATPVALAFQRQSSRAADHDQPADPPAAAVGSGLANAVAEQRQAAQRLADALAAKAEERKDLAAATHALAASATPVGDASPTDAGHQEEEQRRADELQRQADQAETAAQHARDAAVSAHASDDAQQSQAAAERAATAQQQAVEAQTHALAAQLALAHDGDAGQNPDDSHAMAAMAQAAANLSAAQQDSLNALSDAEHDGLPDTAKAAAANLAQTTTALAALAGPLAHAAQTLAQTQTQIPRGETPDHQQRLEHADDSRSADRSGQPDQAGQPPQPAADQPGPPDAKANPAAGQRPTPGGQPGLDEQAATAQAAARALALIRSAAGQRNGFERAAASLRDAAMLARLTQQFAPGQGHALAPVPGQASQPGGPEANASDSLARGGSTTFPAPPLPGADQTTDWAASRAEIRQNVRSGGIEQFSEEHQEAIRAYLKRLGEDK